MKRKTSKDKKLLYVLVAVLAAGMMVFAELFTMYANNVNDFWFDMATMITPTMKLVGVVVAGVLVVAVIAWGLARLFKKEAIFYICFLLGSLGYLTCYVHANFLAGFLPSLDGETIDWGEAVPNVVSVGTVIAIAVAMALVAKKYGVRHGAKIFCWVDAATIVMVLLAVITTALTTPALEPKEVSARATEKNLNLLSSERNYVILLLDAVDAKTFESVLGDDREALKDFTFFPDALAGSPVTRDSIPFIFSGVWNENLEPFEDYSTKAFESAALFDELGTAGFGKRGLYDDELIWRDRGVLAFDNMVSADKDVKTKTFIKQEIKYLMFKMLPYPLKRYSKIESMNYKHAQGDREGASFEWWDRKFYLETLEKPAEITQEKVFAYIHLEGAHVPLNLDENLNEIDGSYEQKVRANKTLIKKYLNYLKQNGAYDNATIVILADHGYDPDAGVPGRQNALLLVKGAGETHEDMSASKKQVSFADLAGALSELANDKQSTEIFADVPEENRERRYLYYVFNYEDHMIEQTTTGKAWETEKLVPTGREFNL